MKILLQKTCPMKRTLMMIIMSPLKRKKQQCEALTHDLKIFAYINMNIYITLMHKHIWPNVQRSIPYFYL